MRKKKQKVLAYVTRAAKPKVELLVFKHKDFPEAGVQVPAGTVKANESLVAAVQRELTEESGLILPEPPQPIGSFLYQSDKGDQHMRHVFHFRSNETIPSNWDHRVTGKGSDKNLDFQFFWIDILQAQNLLAKQQGSYLSELSKSC